MGSGKSRFPVKKLLLFLLTFSCAGVAQDGAALYQKHCASCHDSPKGHAPGLLSLRAMSAAALLRAMDGGVMREPAKTLNEQERKAVAEYLGGATAKAMPAANSPAAYCAASTASPGVSAGLSWNGFGAGLTNTRFQAQAAAGLSAADVPKLGLKWAFGLGDVTMARGQPVVVGNQLFVGTSAGKLYSLDAKSGCIFWVFQADSAIRSGVVAGTPSGGRTTLFFGDARANAYAVDSATGKLVWKTHPEEHGAALFTGAPNFYDGAVYFGISSIEEVFGGEANYECCTFRGSVVALDAGTGATVWKSYTIPEAAKPTGKTSAGIQRSGPSGAAVWSTPTIDVKRNVIYVATGDNYSDPPTETSDAVLAFDRRTGKMLWSRQMTANDAYNLGCNSAPKDNCPDANGPDLDFGQPPILVSLPNGKDELVIGQKSGVAWAIDPDQQGKILWQARVGKGSSLGGSQWGSAADGKFMYIAISDIGFRDVKNAGHLSTAEFELDPAAGGGLFALDLVSGSQMWSAPPQGCGERKNCSPAQPGAVSAIAGAVFEGSLDGHFRAYSSTTGKILWDFDTAREYDAVNGGKAHGGAMDGGGAAIAGGMVYVNSGYGQWGEMPGNVLLAFSVEGSRAGTKGGELRSSSTSQIRFSGKVSGMRGHPKSSKVL